MMIYIATIISKAINPGQLLHVDIVFIAGKPILFSVDDITGYTHGK